MGLWTAFSLTSGLIIVRVGTKSLSSGRYVHMLSKTTAVLFESPLRSAWLVPVMPSLWILADGKSQWQVLNISQMLYYIHYVYVCIYLLFIHWSYVPHSVAFIYCLIVFVIYTFVVFVCLSSLCFCNIYLFIHSCIMCFSFYTFVAIIY